MGDGSLDTGPASLADWVTPSRWAAHHGFSIGRTYELIRSGRLDALNVSAGPGRATYMLDLWTLPKQPDSRTRTESSSNASHAAGPAS